MSEKLPDGTKPRHHPLVRILLATLFVELIVAAGIVAWVHMRPQQAVPKPAKSTTQQPAPLKAPSVALVQFATGLSAPVDIAALPDAADKRLFVVEQAGTIRSLSNEGKVGATPLLDITNNVQYSGEMGLLGLAFHPKFADNGYLYVNYVDKKQNTIIARFTVDKTTGAADTSSQKILLSVKQPYTNHNGGDLAFGPDGYLYIALGDGGSGGDPENRAQNKNELLGKLLRIDADKADPYAIPADNPFAAGGGRPEIWAYGLRNPWRLSFDRTTGDLYIADVGQNLYEEVNYAVAGSPGGQNYGWRCREALHDFNTKACQAANAYVPPVLEYSHDGGNCSITGGYVYRGTQYPALAGNYFFADLCSGQVSYTAAGNQWKATAATSTKYQISTFGEDSSGELYLADVAGGIVYRIEDTANPAR